jgi:phage anti-repressor protein
MSDLIPLSSHTVGSETIQTVNARKLHAFLEVKTRFNDWIVKRISAYGFLQDIDYTVLIFEYGPSNTIKEYFLSLDMAKELAMVERTQKGKDARQYFIACEKAVKEGLHAAMLPEPKVALTLIEHASTLLAKLGHLTERDTLMLADQVRNVMTIGQRLLPGSSLASPAYGFSLAERVAQLGYRLTRRQQASLYPTLGKRVAEEWRQRFTEEPTKESRWVDGAQRAVAWYPEETATWIDPIIQSFLASMSIPLSTPSND